MVEPRARPRQISAPSQLARLRALDDLRCARPLTRAEADEADNLTHRAAMRAWRAVERDTEAARRRRSA